MPLTGRELLEQLEKTVDRISAEAAAREARWRELLDASDSGATVELGLRKPDLLETSRNRAAATTEKAEAELNQIEASFRDWLQRAESVEGRA